MDELESDNNIPLTPHAQPAPNTPLTRFATRLTGTRSQAASQLPPRPTGKAFSAANTNNSKHPPYSGTTNPLLSTSDSKLELLVVVVVPMVATIAASENAQMLNPTPTHQTSVKMMARRRQAVG